MIATIEKMQRKSLARPDDTRSFDKGRVELVTVNDVTFGRATLLPGWKWSTCVKPHAHTQSCEAAHLQYHIAGCLHVVMDDGSVQEFGPGDVSWIPPGHDAWVVGNDPVIVVDISGMKDYAKH
jgi:ethanolamine utilization protein EutQ (cupin superfamily)